MEKKRREKKGKMIEREVGRKGEKKEKEDIV